MSFSEKEKLVLEKAGSWLVGSPFFSERKEQTLQRLSSYLSEKDERTRKQFRLFVKLLPFFALCLMRRSFFHLSSQEGEEFLRRLESFPLKKIQQGIWGLKNFFFLSFYTQEETFPEIDYEGPEKF